MMSMSKKEVIKSSWVIHISHQLSLIQQQIWNVLLAYAYDNLLIQKIHHIDVRVLFSYVGKTRNISHLKNALEELCVIERYNLINKTKIDPLKQKFSLLASAAIEDGLCKYSYSPQLIPYLANPPSYAKINLLMQKEFTSKYSLIIYELCIDYAGVERTKTFTLSEFKNYLGIAENEYKEFKHLNYKIIKKAISEINKKSDLLIAVKFDASHENLLLWFTINKKSRTAIDVKKMIDKVRGQTKQKELCACPFKQLKGYGVSARKVNEIHEFFNAYEVQHTINEMKRDFKKICDPAAWLTAMFNKKKEEKPVKKFKAAQQCTMLEDQKLRRKHLDYLECRLKEECEQLTETRKNELVVPFEQWIAKQDVKVTFFLGREKLHQMFLEEVLLTREERNFEEWLKRT
jgi:hypothetical protein